MKKLIFIATIILSSYSLLAQCVLNTSITSPNILMKCTNLPEAFVGQPYVAQIDVFNAT